MQNSHEWVAHIIDCLFAADDRRLENSVRALNTQNSEIKNKAFHGFIHLGIRFIDPRYKLLSVSLAKHPLPTLSLSLTKELKAFDTDRLKIEQDKAKIRQALVPLMINAVEMQDARDSVPDCVAALVPQFSVLPRMRECITTHIRSDQFALKAYEKALPLMEQYSVGALIY